MLAIGAARVLPNETLSNILGFLSLHDLASVSLASRAYQALAFPGLYHTVYLTLARHLKDLAESIDLDRSVSLSLRSHIRGLVFDPSERKAVDDNDDMIVEEDLECLEAMLSVLTRLDHFYWRMRFVPRNQQVIDTLQTGCSNLKSVELMIYEGDVFEDAYGDYVRLLEFKNLLHFGLTINSVPFKYDGHVEPIVTLLRACPNLESLSLDLRDWGSGRDEWSPDVLFNALGSPTFPTLRTFRVLGSVTPDWYSFFDSPASNPFRTFFSRHPKLHTVGLGWVYECGYYGRIEPEEMAKLFPSLRHLEAPAFFCVPVMASSLVNQLESVAVLDDILDPGGFNLRAIVDRAATLPKLRKLTLYGDGAMEDEEIEISPLKALLNLTPCLEELELRVPLEEPRKLLGVLELSPNLRVLCLYPPVLSGLQESLGVSEWEECIPELANTCRLLTCVRKSWYEFDEVYWIIKREADGRVQFCESTTRRSV